MGNSSSGPHQHGPNCNHGASEQDESHDESKRDFIFISAASMAAVGTGVVAWPFVATLGPAKDTLALSTTEIDLSHIQEGQAVTVMWRGKPVFIRRRTAKDIELAREVDNNTAEFAGLRDKQKDTDRVKQSTFGGKEMPQWLVMVGVCTHLGCVPMGQKPTDMHGDFNGWFCPCHGSHYDSAGRVRKGPAPKNLAVPTYTFLSENRVRIG